MDSMHNFKLHRVMTMACSETNTHLLPLIRFRIDSGVKAAFSSAVIKFEPPPKMTLLMEMTRMVYHTAAFNIR